MTSLHHRLGSARLATIAVVLLAGCTPTQTPAEAPPAAPAGSVLAGWYSQDPAQATLQPCGAIERLVVANGSALRARADRFGLQDGDPVYVLVEGSRVAGGFRLQRIQQFGSPTPVRDCPMTGTSIQQ